MFVWGIAIIFLVSIVGGMAAGASGSREVVFLISLVVLGGWVLTTVGWWLMTTPDPSGLGEDQYGTARKIIRIALIVGIAQAGLNMIQQNMLLDPTLLIGIAIVGGLAGIVAAVGFFAQLNYLKKLALRIPDQKLSDRANFLMYAFAISYGVLILFGIGAAVAAYAAVNGPGGGHSVSASAAGGLAGFACFVAILGLAVLVFAIMYLLLVEKMGKRFKEQAQVARATWAATAFNRPA
jgi:hypothetical protein